VPDDFRLGVLCSTVCVPFFSEWKFLFCTLLEYLLRICLKISVTNVAGGKDGEEGGT